MRYQICLPNLISHAAFRASATAGSFHFDTFTCTDSAEREVATAHLNATFIQNKAGECHVEGASSFQRNPCSKGDTRRADLSVLRHGNRSSNQICGQHNVEILVKKNYYASTSLLLDARSFHSFESELHSRSTMEFNCNGGVLYPELVEKHIFNYFPQVTTSRPYCRSTPEAVLVLEPNIMSTSRRPDASYQTCLSTVPRAVQIFSCQIEL